MNNLTKLVNGVPKAIGLSVAGVILYGTVSCATMTRAQKTALLGDGLSILGSLNTTPRSNGERIMNDVLTISGGVVTNQAQMQHDLEVANAGKSQIIINNNPPAQNYQNQDYNQKSNPLAINNPPSNNDESYKNEDYNQNATYNSTPEGFFMYKKFVDFNNDGLANRDEFIGLNEPVYNLRNLNSLQFAFTWGTNKFNPFNLNLKIYDLEDGNIINYFNESYSNGIKYFSCEGKYFPRSGKYKAVLNIADFKTFSLDFEVVK